MLRVFYDAEFLATAQAIVPISIGMVDDTGSSYYAVVADPDMDWDTMAEINPFLATDVYPHLPLRRTVFGRWRADDNHPDAGAFASRAQIRAEVAAYFAARAGFDDHGDPTIQLWADYGAYDHILLAQLYGTMDDWPNHLPMFTRDLRQRISDLGLHDEDLPERDGVAHHALADAHHNRRLAQALDSYAAARLLH